MNTKEKSDKLDYCFSRIDVYLRNARNAIFSIDRNNITKKC